MCGLVGYIITQEKLNAPDEQKYIKFFRKALFLDTLRGFDSTGVARLDGSGNCSVMKKAMMAPDFLDCKRVTEFLSPLQEYSWALMGHNRAATVGNVNAANAHPFTHGDVTLMHNGTLSWRPKTDKKFDTDSEQICYAISQCTSNQEVITLLESLEGSYALVWYDAKNGKINLARNEERPLVIQETELGMIYASESWILEGALSEPFSTPLKTKGPRTDLKPGAWLSIDRLSGEAEIHSFKPAADYSKYNFKSYSTSRQVQPVPQSPPANGGYERANRLLAADTTLRKGDTVLLHVPDAYVDRSKVQGNSVRLEVFTMDSDGLGAAENIYTTYNPKGREHEEAMAKGLRYLVARVGGAYFSDNESDDYCIWVSDISYEYTEEEIIDGRYDPEDDGIAYNRVSQSPDPDVMYDSKGVALDAAEADMLCNAGCAWCGSPINREVEEITWYDGFLFHKDMCLESYADEVLPEVHIAGDKA